MSTHSLRLPWRKTPSNPVSLSEPGPAGVLWRCLTYLRPYWRKTLGAYLMLAATNVLALAIPQFIRWIVDSGIGGKDTSLLLGAVAALLALMAVKGVITFYQMLWTEQASQSVAYDLRNAIHGKLAALSFSYHDRTETGQAL